LLKYYRQRGMGLLLEEKKQRRFTLLLGENKQGRVRLLLKDYRKRGMGAGKAKMAVVGGVVC
jgi:hypothetical protein